MEELYREHVIWRYLDKDCCYVYHCFEDLSTGKFCLLHSVLHTVPSSIELELQRKNASVSNFLDINLSDKQQWKNENIEYWFDTIEEAINSCNKFEVGTVIPSAVNRH